MRGCLARSAFLNSKEPPVKDYSRLIQLRVSRNHLKVNTTMNKFVGKLLVEVAFVLFLFYANLLMGEFERSGAGQKNGLLWALGDIFTVANFVIGLIAALVAYILFESLRKKL